MSMTTELELAQRMKAAALKLDGEQWQTRDGFSGIEVVVKGSVAKGRGCVSYQPVAAELADSKTAKAIALFSPANIKALVEALEARDKQIAELEREKGSLRPVGVMSEKAYHRLENRESRFIALWPRPEIYLPRKRPEDGVIVFARTAAGVAVEGK